MDANDPEPPEGTKVRDALGQSWVRDDGSYGGSGWRNWVPLEVAGDPETWVKIAGNYGPVELVS